MESFRCLPANEVPPRRLVDEWDGDDEEEQGGEGGGEVEVAPRGLEGVCDAGERGNAAGEEVESGHAGGATLRGANGLRREDEGGEAHAADAKSSEEAEEEVEPVGRGECSEATKEEAHNANCHQAPFSSHE